MVYDSVFYLNGLCSRPTSVYVLLRENQHHKVRLKM